MGREEGGEKCKDRHLVAICITESIDKKITIGAHPGSSPFNGCMSATGRKSTQSLYVVSLSPHPSCGGWQTAVHGSPILDEMLGRKKVMRIPPISPDLLSSIVLF